jgi:thioredoxin-dependent peroxiredoxin
MDAYRDQYATLFRDGRNVVLLAVSSDSAPALASWAHDRDYQFAFLSDPAGEAGKAYGAFEAKYGEDNRTLFVIGPDGRIASVMAPFNEIDATAYTALGDAITKVAGPAQ